MVKYFCQLVIGVILVLGCLLAAFFMACGSHLDAQLWALWAVGMFTGVFVLACGVFVGVQAIIHAVRAIHNV